MDMQALTKLQAADVAAVVLRSPNPSSIDCPLPTFPDIAILIVLGPDQSIQFLSEADIMDHGWVRLKEVS